MWHGLICKQCGIHREQSCKDVIQCEVHTFAKCLFCSLHTHLHRFSFNTEAIKKKVFNIDFIECVIVTNLNSMFSLSHNSITSTLMLRWCPFSSLQLSCSSDLKKKFSIQVLYKKLYIKLEFVLSVQCKPHFAYGHE